MDLTKYRSLVTHLDNVAWQLKEELENLDNPTDADNDFQTALDVLQDSITDIQEFHGWTNVECR